VVAVALGGERDWIAFADGSVDAAARKGVGSGTLHIQVQTYLLAGGKGVAAYEGGVRRSGFGAVNGETVPDISLAYGYGVIDDGVLLGKDNHSAVQDGSYLIVEADSVHVGRGY